MASKELIDYVEGVKALIKKNGLEFKYIEALYKSSLVSIDTENDVTYGLYLTKLAKICIEKLFEKEVSRTVFDIDKYCMENNVTMDEIELFWKIMKKESLYLFDSYMLYLEKNRAWKDKFYMPRRKCFLKIGLVQALQDLEDDKLDLLAISLVPGAGKCGDMDSKVLTPKGYVKMRDIHVGDKVISGTGKVAEVTGVFPQKKRPMYKFVLNDGSSTIVSDNHLWKVQTRSDRNTGKYRIIETKDMLENIRVEKDNRLNYSIDYVPRIDFEEKNYYIHPYVLGCLLGDGTIIDSICFSKKDKEVIGRMNSLIDGYEFVIKRNSDKDYYLRSKSDLHERETTFRKELKKLELLGTKCDSKFIPTEYLYGSYEQRLELLRGLLDTDGYASEKCIEYTTTSFQLSEDVKELVHSLGGYCSVVKRKSGYINENNEYIQCKDSYRLTIQFSANHDNPFWLKRKADIYRPKRTKWKRYVQNIEYLGDRECQCIMIDDPSHLYITDDYIITHNTTIEKFFTTWVIGKNLDDCNLFFSHSGDITRMYYDGINDITNSDEYTWHEIFPMANLQSTNAKTEQLNFGKYKPFASIQCTSIGSKNSGKVRASRYLLCDDLIGGIEEALNKNYLEKLWGIYTVDARQRKLDGCKEIHIATRWSTIDVIGRLQEIEKDNERARFIAVPDIDPDTGESNFAYDINGFSAEFFHDQEKLMDDVSYRCLYKNDPIEREGLLYAEDSIRRYVSLPNKEPDAIIGVCDTKTTGKDYMVLVVFYQYDSDYYLVDCICDDNSDFVEQYRRLSNIIVEHNMQQCEFESNAGGSRLAYEVDKLVKEKGGKCNITTKATETNKETRIIVNSDFVKTNCLFKDKSMYANKTDYGQFMNFMCSYSIVGKNKFDDVCDCLANFALFIRRKFMIKETVIMKSPF